MNKGILKATGILISCFLLCFFAFAFFPYKYIPFPGQNENAILIEGIHVVDVETDFVLPMQHFLLVDGRIEAIPDKSILRTYDRTKVIKAPNMYLISGLWDRQVHLTKQSPHLACPEFIRYGVTMYGTCMALIMIAIGLQRWSKDLMV